MNTASNPIIALTVAAIAVLSYFYLSSVKGEKLTKSNSPVAVLKKPSILSSCC
jgi:hypothetical protein